MVDFFSLIAGFLQFFTSLCKIFMILFFYINSMPITSNLSLKIFFSYEFGILHVIGGVLVIFVGWKTARPYLLAGGITWFCSLLIVDFYAISGAFSPGMDIPNWFLTLLLFSMSSIGAILFATDAFKAGKRGIGSLLLIGVAPCIIFPYLYLFLNFLVAIFFIIRIPTKSRTLPEAHTEDSSIVREQGKQMIE